MLTEVFVNEREKEVLSEKMVFMVMLDCSPTSGNHSIVDST